VSSAPDEPVILASALRRMDGVSGATAVLDPPAGSWAIRLTLIEDVNGWQAFRRLTWLRENAGEVQSFALDWVVGPRPVDGPMTAMLVGTEGTANIVAQRVRDELVWRRS
jgi:hypothetical protein